MDGHRPAEQLATGAVSAAAVRAAAVGLPRRRGATPSRARVLLGARRAELVQEKARQLDAATRIGRSKRQYKSAGGIAVCGLESGAGRGSAPWMDRNQRGCEEEERIL